MLQDCQFSDALVAVTIVNMDVVSDLFVCLNDTGEDKFTVAEREAPVTTYLCCGLWMVLPYRYDDWMTRDDLL